MKKEKHPNVVLSARTVYKNMESSTGLKCKRKTSLNKKKHQKETGIKSPKISLKKTKNKLDDSKIKHNSSQNGKLNTNLKLKQNLNAGEKTNLKVNKNVIHNKNKKLETEPKINESLNLSNKKNLEEGKTLNSSSLQNKVNILEPEHESTENTRMQFSINKRSNGAWGNILNEMLRFNLVTVNDDEKSRIDSKTISNDVNNKEIQSSVTDDSTEENIDGQSLLKSKNKGETHKKQNRRSVKNCDEINNKEKTMKKDQKTGTSNTQFKTSKKISKNPPLKITDDTDCSTLSDTENSDDDGGTEEKISPSKKRKFNSKDRKSPVKIRNIKPEKKMSQAKKKKLCLKQEEVKDPTQISNMNFTEFVELVVNDFQDSIRVGKLTLDWILHPLKTEVFFKDYWEKKCHIIESGKEDKFQGILSKSDIHEMLKKNTIMFSKNIDITSYRNGKRETHNPEGQAFPSIVWDYYNKGCSVRILNPQTFHKPIWRLLASLQEYFNSFCGANVYLTPPGTQGFAPHWDDIEAFVIQLEGRKKWKVYQPRKYYTLPRKSSGNFGPDDDLGTLVIEKVLKPGQVLYMPRGYIHQAQALPQFHSLHITISTFQNNCWADLLEKLLPAALENAVSENVSFREGLPIDSFNYCGIAHSEKESNPKMEFIYKIKEMVVKMLDYAPVAAAVDQMGKSFVYDSLPPFIDPDNCDLSVYDRTNLKVYNPVNMCPSTKIRLVRGGCIRLVVEDNMVKLFYSTENSLEYHGDEAKFLEVDAEMAPGIEYLIHSYPAFKPVDSLPVKYESEKMDLATVLLEKGIIVATQEEKDERGGESTDNEINE